MPTGMQSTPPQVLELTMAMDSYIVELSVHCFAWMCRLIVCKCDDNLLLVNVQGDKIHMPVTLQLSSIRQPV